MDDLLERTHGLKDCHNLRHSGCEKLVEVRQGRQAGGRDTKCHVSGAKKDSQNPQIARTAPKNILNNSRGLPVITQ